MTTITKIETIRVALPFETGGPRHGMRPALGAWLKMESVMLRIETSDGLEGWGEAFGHVMAPGAEVVLNTVVAPLLLGKDAREISKRIDEIERPMHGLGRAGPMMYALSAVDIALWDLAGKRAGMPVFRLLGGDGGELTRYASLMRYGGDCDAVAENVARARGHGFTTIKLHENTVPAFRAARQAVNPEDNICLDVNCPWTVAEARAIAQEILYDDFHWLEEPVWPPEDYAAMAEVRAEGVPISAGENMTILVDFKAAFEAGAVDNVQPSVIKCGGISGMRRVFALAQAYAVRVVPHCFYWGPGYHATAHLAASRPEPTLVETAFITFAVRPHALFDSTASTLQLTEAPGLGFEADWDALAPYVVSRNTVSA
ncbi:MAG: mandelate racemase/muconate lactonizing enzyme family protein [Proteobacteria bacterium]|nr:mandelate racemase/muconate lactonizing enzyme family protein [Pseudomonadota bacterium]